MNDVFDPYQVLGVSPDATDEEIRRAYVAQVLRCHPDRTGGDDFRTFLEVRKAYELLRDPETRRAYDARRRGGASVSLRAPGVSVGVRVAGRCSTRAGPFLRDRLSMQLVLTPAEAVVGGWFLVAVPLRQQCPVCSGWLTRWPRCYRCRGWGEVQCDHFVEIGIDPGIRDGTRALLSLAHVGAPGVWLDVTVKIER